MPKVNKSLNKLSELTAIESTYLVYYGYDFFAATESLEYEIFSLTKFVNCIISHATRS